MDPEQAREAAMAEAQKAELHQPFDATVGQTPAPKKEDAADVQGFASIADLANAGAPKPADYSNGMSEEDTDYWSGGKVASTTEGAAPAAAATENRRSLREIGSQAREAGRAAREAREPSPWMVKAKEVGTKVVEGIKTTSDVINGLDDPNVRAELKGWMGEKVQASREAAGRGIRAVIDKVNGARERAWNATTGKLADIRDGALDLGKKGVDKALVISKTVGRGAAKGTLFVAGLPIAAGAAVGAGVYEGGKLAARGVVEAGKGVVAAERKAAEWGGRFVSFTENQGRMIWNEMKAEQAQASAGFQEMMLGAQDWWAERKINAAAKAVAARENRQNKAMRARENVQRYRTAGAELRATAPRATRA